MPVAVVGGEIALDDGMEAGGTGIERLEVSLLFAVDWGSSPLQQSQPIATATTKPPINNE
jgi:hypothetical protein